MKEDEVEELVNRPGTTKGTLFAVLHCIRLPFFDELWVFDHWSNGKYTRDLCRVFRVKELPVYLPEALLSRINPSL